MSAKAVQQRRSQVRAAKKRAGNRPGPRSMVVAMTPEEMRQMAAPIISELVVKHGLPETIVATVIELMVEQGGIGLDGRGQLASRLPD